MPDHDQLFKTLFKTFFGNLLRLALPALAGRLRVDEPVFLDPETFTDVPDGRHRRLDLVAQVPAVARDSSAEEAAELVLVLVHVEVEGRASAEMGRRLWRYAMQLRLRHELPVVPLVVNLRGGREVLAKDSWVEALGEEVLNVFHYFAFNLGAGQAPAYVADPHPLAWGLAALMRRGPWSAARHKLECLRPIARGERPGSAALNDAEKFLLVNCVETYVELEGEDHMAYQALLAEEEDSRDVALLETTWADRIEAQGMEKGREAGRQEGLRQALLRLMERRFGSLPRSVARRVEAITSPEELTHLLDRVLTSASLEEMGLG